MLTGSSALFLIFTPRQKKPAVQRGVSASSSQSVACTVTLNEVSGRYRMPGAGSMMLVEGDGDRENVDDARSSNWQVSIAAGPSCAEPFTIVHSTPIVAQPPAIPSPGINTGAAVVVLEDMRGPQPSNRPTRARGGSHRQQRHGKTRFHEEALHDHNPNEVGGEKRKRIANKRYEDF